MRKLLIILVLVLGFITLQAQDVIMLIDGSEIDSKIIELANESIRYKKYDNQEGPDHVISKEEVFMIRFENGEKLVINDLSELEEANENLSSRQGFYIGAHLAPGIGHIIQEQSSWHTAFNGGLNLDFYFNDYVGVHTGFSYQFLPVRYTFLRYNYPNLQVYSSASGNVQSFGIPIKFIFASGKRIGFYIETGFGFYMPISSRIHVPCSSEDIVNKQNQFVLAEETSLGVNLRPSKKEVIKLGVFIHYSLTDYFVKNPNISALPEDNSKGFMIGINLAILFKAGK